jgi:holo-[acyl-carrier protein] synthase
MILRSGIDLLEVKRLEQVNPAIRERFIARVYTPAEIAESKGLNEYFAGRFCVKEAVSKALGTGIGFVNWQHIECLDGPHGEPVLKLHGNGALVAEQLGLEVWSVSISHTDEYATAMAVAIGGLPLAEPDEPSEKNASAD